MAYMMEARMTPGQIVVTVTGAVIGGATAFWLNAPIAVLIVIMVAWWIGRRLFPVSAASQLQIQLEEGDFRLCTRCRYCLRGLSDEGLCPECGSPFVIAEVQHYWQRALQRRKRA
jgi:hypothetical protein